SSSLRSLNYTDHYQPACLRRYPKSKCVCVCVCKVNSNWVIGDLGLHIQTTRNPKRKGRKVGGEDRGMEGWRDGGLGVGVEVVLGLVRMRADSRIVPSRALRAGRAAH